MTDRKYTIVGTLVKLKRPCLGNDIGTIGVAYWDYGDGFQVIFANGEYDGFGLNESGTWQTSEAEGFLEPVGFAPSVENYQFKNVIKLTEDFRNGLFDEALKKQR